MTKKITAFVLTLALLAAGSCACFAAELSDDTVGTKYEEAVTTLIGLSVLSGYEDGTFRPENSITRAEMAAVIVRATGKTTYDQTNDTTFKDIKGLWSEGYITIAFHLGAVTGRSAAMFDPSGNVTIAEAATMLLRMTGFKDDGTAGKWPAAFMTKAKDMGMLEDISADEKGSAFATRGDVALMTAQVVGVIRDLYKEVTETTDGAIEAPDNGKLSEYSGRAIGLPLSVSTVLTKGGSIADELEFLMSDRTYNFQTERKGQIKESDFITSGTLTGGLYVVRLRNGVARDVSPASASNLTRYIELTDDGTSTFKEITENKNNSLKTTGGGISEFTFSKDVICYEAVFENGDLTSYKSVSAGNIDTGDYIRAFDLDEDLEGIAIVIIIIDKADAAAAAAHGFI